MAEELTLGRRRFFGLAAKAIIGIQLGAATSESSQLGDEIDLPTFREATAWLNSQSLTKADLRGKVVLVDFWTYSCINWRRTLPYLRAWAKKYQPNGLVLIGVHTPEFDFEKDIRNVQQAAKDMTIDYPIALDNSYGLWHAFNNEYWPALYFVEGDGKIVEHKFGEGDYEQSERAIQQLLIKAGATNFDRKLVSIDAMGAEVAADWKNLRSEENYVGYERTANFASPGGLKSRKCQIYSFPERLKLNHWALDGTWTAEKQALSLNAHNGRIAYQFHARDLHLVMGPGERTAAVRFRVRIDGEPPGAAHGADADEQGNGIVNRPRMYQLVRQRQSIVDRKFEIEFLDTGVEVFSFTFG